jgi:predicted DsbA family dithiol-disulfide isomerase
VRTDVVEVSGFPDLAQQYNVYAVPKTVVNDTYEIVGALPERQFVEAVLHGAEGQEIEGEGSDTAETTPVEPDG